MPRALTGRDVIVKAWTGSGKATVFGLAALQCLDLHIAPGAPQALVLSPTRELAAQLVTALRKPASPLEGVRVVACTGGADNRDQKVALASGVHVVVGTPGRIRAHLSAGTLDPSMVHTLVLDEADSLLDMGFEDEVNAVVKQMPQKNERQTLLFSATWSDRVQRLGRRVTSRPVIADDDAHSASEEQQVGLSQHAVLFPANVNRLLVLSRVLVDHSDGLQLQEPGDIQKTCLVFCETKLECTEVAKFLRRQGASALALHSDLDQVSFKDVNAYECALTFSALIFRLRLTVTRCCRSFEEGAVAFLSPPT